MSQTEPREVDWMTRWGNGALTKTLSAFPELNQTHVRYCDRFLTFRDTGKLLLIFILSWKEIDLLYFCGAERRLKIQGTAYEGGNLVAYKAGHLVSYTATHPKI